MIRKLGKSIFSFLPYETRRYLFRVLSSESYRRLQGIRTIETHSGYSLKPFDDLKCIFVHIPKCAGISICKGLFGNLAGGHESIARYQLVFSKSEFNSYFKFTFVRNPWDRLVSAYHFLKEGGFNETDRKWAEANLSGYPDFNMFVKNWVNRKNVMYKHFYPQYKFICGYGNTPIVDFLGYFENLEEDFSYIRRRLGVESNLLFLNKGQGRKRDYKEYYTEETIKIVSDVYREDIQILGYSFDNSSLETQLTRRCTLVD